MIPTLPDPVGKARTKPSSPEKPQLPGLNPLRFWAALAVVLDHARLNQGSVGLPVPFDGPVFGLGGVAVDLFFCLSGFLITYLLLAEHDRTGRISVNDFYVRRVLRIWPLYFLVVAYGLVFYFALLPLLGISYPLDFSLGPALGLYLVFLPQVMSSVYRVGGILNPLWSIGIEEQFYLVWAPSVKAARRWLPWLCGSILVVFLTLGELQQRGTFGSGWGAKLVSLSRFHYMGAGGLLGWALRRHRDRLLALRVFSWRPLQVVCIALLVDLVFLGWMGRLKLPLLAYEVLRIGLYCWMLVEVSANPRRLLPVGGRRLESLGNISYGIYMHHMVCIYATSALFLRTSWWKGYELVYGVLYLGTAVGLTVAVSWVSYRIYEKPFLRLKDLRYTPLLRT